MVIFVFVSIAKIRTSCPPRNPTKAIDWYRDKAEKGDAHAQWKIGSLYAEGHGAPQDYSEALKWLCRSADQGYAPAQKDIGRMYAEGQGIPKDLVRAHMWFNLSASQPGSYRKETQSQAAQEREKLTRQMTSEEIAQAQKLAKDWAPNQSG